MSTSIPHVSEEYFCEKCDAFKKLMEVNKNWKCPVCQNYVHIRIITNNKNNACYRVPVSELKVDDMVLLEREDDYRVILGITDLGNSCLLGIQNFRGIKLSKDRDILKLDGGWYH